jgi:hypothetical protein
VFTGTIKETAVFNRKKLTFRHLYSAWDSDKLPLLLTVLLAGGCWVP